MQLTLIMQLTSWFQQFIIQTELVLNIDWLSYANEMPLTLAELVGSDVGVSIVI